MKRQLQFGIIMLMAGGLFLTTCHKEYFELEKLSDEMLYEPTIVLPLLFGSFDMSDIAEVIDSTDYTLEDEEGEPYYLVYTDTIFTLDDTVEFEPGLEEDRVTYLRLTTQSINELALDMVMQIYLQDTNYVVLDSVFDNNGIELGPAQIDSDGRLITATEDENSSTFEAEKIGILDEVSFLWVKARMRAAKEGEDFVKIYAAYSLEYDISLLVNASVNTSD